MNKDIIKKIFTKKVAEDFLRKENPNMFKKKKINYTFCGSNDEFWNEMTKLPLHKIKTFARDYVIKNKKGKYYNIAQNEEKTIQLIKETIIKKEDSPCHPECFSENVVKKNVRKEIKKYYTDSNYNVEILLKNLHEENEKKLYYHEKERISQQLKADYSEYLLLQSDENIIPTLKNTKGTDMYFIENGKIIDLDIKTTRNAFGLENEPIKAIQKLYEKQGKDRFSSNQRTLIFYSNNLKINQEQIKTQLQKTYSIDFFYGKKKYHVDGVRFIYI